MSDLATLIGGAVPGLASRPADLRWLTAFAVDVRYPGVTATRPEAERALRVAVDARSLLRIALGLAAT